MSKTLLTGLLILFSASLLAQQDTVSVKDSLAGKTLPEVMIKAYEQNRQLREVSAAINVISHEQLERFNNTSLLPALNATPGVRMEERSPASYRLNIRGSTLRSPFGIRNVKIYWNDIPLTDPGGNTYLNQLSFYNVQSIEVIKGPAGSLYGAGTGGAMLIRSQPQAWQPGASVNYIHGGFGLNSINAQVRAGKDNNRNTFTYTHESSDGYRQHTAMRRDIASWETQLRASERQQLNAYFLYSDLYYQTPGGLNKAEYTTDPRAARPAAGGLPGADQAKAAIFQKTFIAGFSSTWHFNSHWKNTSAVYGAYTRLNNPTFRNYEQRDEPHFGGRTSFTYNRDFSNASLQVVAGMEAQKGFFNARDFGNRNGQPDTLQTDDKIDTWIYSGFAQADLGFAGGWSITAGISINKSSIGITRLSVPSLPPQKRTYSNEWAPRIALSKKISSHLLLYASLSKGFSPPTVAEVLPSTGAISTSLEAEHGLDYEAGIKSSWLQQRLYIEVNAFYYRLQNAIVSRKDSSNADYYVNAGSTKQKGIESQVSYQLLPSAHRFLSGARVWISHTLNGFRYQDFKQAQNDYSGKKLPGVASNTVAAGLDLTTRIGLYSNITYYYSDPVALNDANSDHASGYHLLGARLGFKKDLDKKIRAQVFAGADNLFNTRYSLGNDINAAGGRYYNAAAGRNYYAGISLQYNFL